MSKPVHVSDHQISLILSCAQPLPRADHDAYLAKVAEQLRQCSDPGDGDVFRACALAQRALFTPPVGEHRNPRSRRR
jgi:hypothetical protein